MRIKNALISVSDKTGLPELATALIAEGAKIYSTGGTAAALKAAGCEVTDVATLTGDNEMLGGRVKTLHPNVHAAILADMHNDAHVKELADLKLPKLDLVVVNFYPFERVVAESAQLPEVIENIDIGGPTMVRAAAKNYTSTIVLTDPNDYPLFVGYLKSGELTTDISLRWAAKAFIKVAHLDAAIANYFSRNEEESDNYQTHRFLHLEKVADLRYGENPHQAAACYRLEGDSNAFTQLLGPPLSYNNLLDAHSACLAASWHSAPVAVIVKHNNPCGIATAETSKIALTRALYTDPVSAFGGVVAFNCPIDEDVAQILQESFWEVVIAPQVTAAAKSVLALKERLRLLVVPSYQDLPQQFTSMGRLMLTQAADHVHDFATENAVVSKRIPDAEEIADLQFAWRAAAAVKSNSIVIAHKLATVAIGAGQMSRVDSALLACEKAKRRKVKLNGSVAASDGFFPFADGVEVLAQAGVTAIVQPGGSKNDDEIIAAADAANISMVMTGKRHFRH